MAAELPSSFPVHSVDLCPLCGCGLCGIRVCGMNTDHPHGLVVCDECEALWTEPDTTSEHQWRDAEDPRCPICNESLWSSNGRWALREDLERIGWQDAFNPRFSADTGY